MSEEEIPSTIFDSTQEEANLKEFAKYRELFRTNRKFRKMVYSKRFSNVAIKPSLK